MTSNAYAVMGVSPEADDDAIRRRYLELVKQFSPERHPEKFAAIRSAYEELRDLDTRLNHRLFETGSEESVEAIIEEIVCRSSRPRLTLEALLANHRKG